jgi:hypothetical protein
MWENKLSKVWRYGIKDYPKRLKRFAYHLISLLTLRSQIPESKWYDWPVDLIFYTTDLIFIPEIQMTVIVFIKPNIRSLYNSERELINGFYTTSINLNHVLLNSSASLLVKKFAYAYVTHNIVHYEDKVKDEIMIHEMMHVLQFQKFGSVYIYRALKAQKSKYGYDYGGIARLERGIIKGKSIFQYNFEQQAMIMEDYFLATKLFGKNNHREKELKVYQYYHESLFS